VLVLVIFSKKDRAQLNFPSRNLFSLKSNEVRVWGKNLKHQGSRASKGIKGRKIEKTKHHQALHQKVFQCRKQVKLRFGGRI
jgi:hypothetical protein